MDDDFAQAATIGVIGDVHLFWDEADVAFFNGAGYDLLLFVGDLKGYTQLNARRVTDSLQKLRVPAMFDTVASLLPPALKSSRSVR